MDLTHALIVAVVSLLAGFLGGQVGGGGLLTLPVLLFIGLPPYIALGTNRFAAIFLNLTSAIAFYRHKKLAIKHVLLFGGLSLIGAVLGVWFLFSIHIDQVLLKKIVIGVLLVLAVMMLFLKKLGLEEQELKLSKKHFFSLIILLFATAIYGGILGVAMTTLFALIFALNKQSFVQSMGYALFCATIVSIASTVVFIINGAIDWPYAILQTITGGIGAYFGSKYAIKKGNLWIKYVSLVAIVAFLIKLFFEI